MFFDLPIEAIADGRLSWNDPEVQEHIKHLDDCEWYEWKGFLYVVDEKADELIHGPDDEIARALYDALQNGAYTHRLEDHVEGIAYVSWMLHRFNTVDGFYHA